jgi:hypothetical protein
MFGWPHYIDGRFGLVSRIDLAHHRPCPSSKMALFQPRPYSPYVTSPVPAWVDLPRRARLGMILQCPRCRSIRTWTREALPDGPGHCSCGARGPWKALPAMPEPGHVIVLSSKGRQELHGPHFREDPEAWVPE